MAAAMNRVILLLAYFFIAAFISPPAGAEDRPNVPNSLWEKSAQGISLAFVLKETQIDGQSKKRIEVYIRNDSHESKYYSDSGVQAECPIEYFDQGRYHSLYEETYSGGPTIDPIEIKPGAIHTVNIVLEPTELAIVKSRPVKCCVGIWDASLKKNRIWVNSSRRTLMVGP
jgi:hypothetical protein